MAQAIGALSDTVSNSVGVGLTPLLFADLPVQTGAGALCCVSNSNTAVWGAVIAGGGANKVLAFYNGTNWTVAGK
jgi:hypothetical protein